MQEKFIAKIVPVENHPDLREIPLTLNTETVLGRGRKTGIFDKYISRNQIRIVVVRNAKGYGLDFTPLAKPSCIKQESSDQPKEIPTGVSETIYPNDIFYFSRLKFPFRFQLFGDEKLSEEEISNNENNLKPDGTTLDEINLAEEEPTKAEDNETKNGEAEVMDVDVSVNIESVDDATDFNKTTDEVDFNERLEDQEEEGNDEKIIEDTEDIQTTISMTESVEENNVDSHDDEISSKNIEQEQEKVVEEGDNNNEEIKEESAVDIEKDTENQISDEKVEKLEEQTQNEIRGENKETDNLAIIEDSLDSKDENTTPIASVPIDISTHPAFLLLVSKVTSLEAQLKSALGEIGEKLNKVTEIYTPRESKIPLVSGYEADESSDAIVEAPVTKKKSITKSPAKQPAKTPTKSPAKPSPKVKASKEVDAEAERMEKEKKEKEKEKERKENERKEKEKEKEKELAKQKEKERKDQERKKREKEKEAKLLEKQKQKEDKEEKEAKAKITSSPQNKKTTPKTTPTTGKRKRGEENEASSNKKKKSDGELWAVDQERLFKWDGDKYKENNKTFYSGVMIDGEVYSIGDTVYLTSPADVPYYIGKILALWEDSKGKKWVQISWFFYHQDVTEILGAKAAKLQGVEPFNKKLYGSIQTDNNPVVTIEKKCDVKHISELGDISNPKKWATEKEENYYFEKYFDSRTKKISYSPDMDSLEMMFEYPDKRLA